MFAKIFAQIYDSSIVEEPEMRFTFMDMLVLSDINGVVDMTHEAIARRTNRQLETVRATIAKLESPDPRSRTPDHDGCRLKRLDDHRDWGWIIVNYGRFRQIASEEQRREKTLARVQKHREKANKSEHVTPCNAPVTQANGSNAMQKQKQKQKKDIAGQARRPYKKVSEASPEHPKFMALWKAAFENRFRRAYKFTARDGKAVKNLLNEPNATAEDLMSVVLDAWKQADRDPKKNFYCAKLVEIHQIENQWNQIQSEISVKPQREESIIAPPRHTVEAEHRGGNFY